MKIKANISFGGNYNMTVGEVREVKDDSTVKSLIKNGLVEIVKEPKPKKTKTDE